MFAVMETRIDPSKLEETFRLLGFHGYTFSPTRGFVGGIAVAWKTDKVAVQVDINDFQFLFLHVNFQDGFFWCFTPSYGSPIESTRNHL